MSCFLEAMVLYAKINLTLSRHPDWDGYPSVKILYLIFLSVRQKLTALTKKVGGSLECHLCIAGMYSYVLLRLAPDRFYQQSTGAEKYLDEDKKNWRWSNYRYETELFFTRSPVFENYGILCSTCQPSIVILHSDASTNVQDCLPMHSLWSFVPSV